ncbi:hypothetical protein JXR93_07860 [bacterium]|nr:hypothetical protein [bacterium]
MRKILSWLFAGTTSILMSACYGVVEDYNSKQIDVNVTDTSNNPIPGLDVAIKCGSYVQSGDYTNNFGEAIITVDDSRDLDSCNLIITDVDAEQNGGQFAEQIVPMSNSKVIYDVQMQLEEK